MSQTTAESSDAGAFNCSYSPNIAELLFKLDCSLIISTYQAGKIIFISSQKGNSLIQLPRTFMKPMGIAIGGGKPCSKIAIACKDEIIVLANSADLGFHYPKKPQTYDAFFVPRLTYHTGFLDIHDLYMEEDSLYAVNTLFSCIVTFDEEFNFKPYWIPPFISSLSSEDRCHLNGMVMVDGKPKYVTTFGQGDTLQSWRDNVTTGGILMDVESNDVIVDNLPMPHSPRLIKGELFVLFSATSELAKINIEKGSHEVILKLNGFVRGMAHYGDYLFIGTSSLRKSSSTFEKLPIMDKEVKAGISIVHLPSAKIIGEISYSSSVEEIYDVHVLPGITRPNIMNTINPEYKSGLVIPGNTFWAKPDQN